MGTGWWDGIKTCYKVLHVAEANPKLYKARLALCSGSFYTLYLPRTGSRSLCYHARTNFLNGIKAPWNVNQTNKSQTLNINQVKLD